MAIAWGTATAGAGTTSATPSYPTGITAATSRLICIVTGRSDTAGTAPTMPAGWTYIGGIEGGDGAWGVDTGPRRVDFFAKDNVTGSESGTVTVSLAGSVNNTMRAHIARIEVAADYLLDMQFSGGADSSSGAAYSATAAGALGFAAGDLLLVATAQNIDTGTQTGIAISASGVTFDVITGRVSTAITNGNDHRAIIATTPVLSGAGDSAPTYSYTISAAGSGATGFLRLREIPPTLVTDDIAHGQSIEQPGISAVLALSPADASNATSIDAATISAMVALSAADIAHANLADAPVISAVATLLAADSAHANLIDTAILSAALAMTPADLRHEQFIESASVLAMSVISPADLLHFSGVDIAFVSSGLLSVPGGRALVLRASARHILLSHAGRFILLQKSNRAVK